VQRRHYFFLSSFGHRVYDLWFDMTVADPSIVEEILSSAYVAGYASGGRYDLEAPATLRLGGFQLTVPENYGYIRKGDTQLELVKQRYWSENILLGGAVVRPLPEVALDGTNYIEWVKATGIDYDEKRDSFAVSDDTPYGDLSASIDDLKNGKPVKDIIHYFYIQGDVVYDLWFDELQIDEKTQQKILDSIRLWDFGDVVTIDEENEAQTIRRALESCRAVLEMVQNSESYKIETYRVNGSGALNPTSTFTELGHGENRLVLNRIPESGGESLFGSLLWEGIQYECDSQAIWQKCSAFDLAEPWLVSYRWNEETIAYVDTLTDDEGTTVKLRINEKNPAVESSDSQYFVNFRFTPEGSFRDVTVQCSRYQSDAVLETESIVTLDPDIVWAEMNEEAWRAIAGTATEGAPVVTDTVRYQKSFENDDGTVTITVDTLLVPAQLEKNGLTVEQIQTAVEQELRRKTVDNYGLDTTAVGHVGARCEIHVTQIRSGDDYLVAADKAVPTLEVWGTRTYVFSNGDRLGEEQGSIKLLLLNASDGTILISFGEKN